MPPVSGSSPRVWGIPIGLYAAWMTARFIPTRVGNTGRMEIMNRMRFGSSPRVWGIRSSARPLSRAYRFIPTRVGNTKRRPRTRDCPPVHPHACGEYFVIFRHIGLQNGSSPRVWGILIVAGNVCLHARFIPTRVGNTAGQRRSWP